MKPVMILLGTIVAIASMTFVMIRILQHPVRLRFSLRCQITTDIDSFIVSGYMETFDRVIILLLLQCKKHNMKD